MKKILILLLALWTILSHAESQHALVTASQQYVKQYAGRLKFELQGSLKSEGAVAAIEHCNSAVPDIARDLNENAAWQIGRTSLKVRNPENTADNWERAVLLQFEKRKKQGEAVNILQYHEIVEKDGHSTFRYMKAIPTQPVCLTCHGEKISASVADKLKQLYPEDQATGFKIGDIRGAFTVSHVLD